MLERGSPIPLYQQLKALLAARIESGHWRPGDPVPGDQELVARYAVSRATVRQAFRELEEAGLVTRHRGRGTFVARPKLAHGPGAGLRLVDALRAQGLEPGWRVLACETVPAGPALAARLELPPGARVLRLRRLRLADGAPIGVHAAHAPHRSPSEPARDALERGESLDYLGAAARAPGVAIERELEAGLAEAAEAADLELEPGAAVLRIRRRVRSAGGRVLEDLAASYRGDRFQYRIASGGARV